MIDGKVLKLEHSLEQIWCLLALSMIIDSEYTYCLKAKNKCKNWWKKILRSMRKTSVKYLKFCSICTFFSHKLQRYFEGWDTKGIFKEKSWHTFSSFLYAQFVNGCQNAKKVVAKEGKFYLINATKKLLSSLQLQN